VAEGLVLAIDQGTTSTRAIAFDREWRPVATAARRLSTAHPRPGWAEQDADMIVDSVVDTVAEVIDRVGGIARIEAAGLANQGETVVAWDAETGRALSPAVLWHCARSEAIVERMNAAGRGPAIADLTGLPLDPYFSASKLRWLLEEVPEVAAAAARGTLRFGTVDAWVTACLGGAARTDPSTASRTQLAGLATGSWVPELLDWWGIPGGSLPVIVPSAGDLGRLEHPRWGGSVPLTSMLCDQQAALYGNGCVEPGAAKVTYGTGVFVLANAGKAPPPRPEGILATVACGAPNGDLTYALDGGVLTAGALIEWLVEPMRLATDAADVARLAASVEDTAGVRVLPALAGLGAPWWDRDARAVIAGLHAGATPAHVARAAFDAIAHRVCDVVEAMAPALREGALLRVDGGLTAVPALMARQASLLGRAVEIAPIPEATALGVAAMAAAGAGLDRPDHTSASGAPRIVEPQLDAASRSAERAAWHAFRRTAASLA
jgi:glycerol kinase